METQGEKTMKIYQQKKPLNGKETPHHIFKSARLQQFHNWLYSRLRSVQNSNAVQFKTGAVN